MSSGARGHRAGALLALVFLTTLGPTLSAQDRDRLRTRADSLLSEWRLAQAFADLVDSLERARAEARRDTIRVGSLRIITTPSPLPLRRAAGLAWPVIDSLFGTGAARLADRPYVIIPLDPDTAVAPPIIHAGLAVAWDVDVEALRALLLANVPLTQDPALAAWLGGALRPSERGLRQREAVYLELVTAPSAAVRECFLGDLAACRAVLDVGGPADALERWYPTGPERRALVTGSLAGFFNRGGAEAAFRACAAGGEAACTSLLHSLPEGTLPRPLGHSGREAFLKLALRLGGRDAYVRLIAEPEAPLPVRIAAAAGVSVDSLIAQWHAEILAARPAPVALPPFAIWIALGWTAVLGGFALRSSRWRIG